MIALTQNRLRTLLGWVVILLLVVPVGGALWMGFAHGESPCILCWAQRTSMILIALVALFVIRYGPRPRYLGMVILLGAWGTFMALRHSALHLARDVGQGFSAPILGVHTYVWAWFIHFMVLIAVGKMLFVLREEPLEAGVHEPGPAGRVAMILFLVLAAANAVQAFISTGPPPYMGQADPVRLSLNPRHWVWMNNEETAGRMSLRGSWTIPRPDPAALDVDPDPANGPIADVPAVMMFERMRIGAPLEGPLTGLARDPATGRFLAVTDRFGVYVLDSTLTRVEHHVVLDPGFSIDLTPLAGAAFVGDTLAVLSTNKSYVLLRPDAGADADAQWRFFLETDGTIAELRRSRFATVRARQQYVLSLAYDADADEFITVSVPSARHPRLVVSRFDRRDLTLSSEFLPELAAGVTFDREDRSLGEYVVTGAAVADGLLYAFSAAYSTLLVIDLPVRAVTAAYAIPGVEHPVGLAVRGDQLLVVQADGQIVVVERARRPAPPPL